MSPPQGIHRIFGAEADPGSTFPNRYRTVLDDPNELPGYFVLVGKGTTDANLESSR
jgi:hypothetical protein